MTENTIQLLPDVLAILNAAPGAFLVSLPDAPKFTVVAVTEAYLLATFTNRKEVIGRGIIEVMTARPDRLPPFNSETLRASLTRILKNEASKPLLHSHQILTSDQTGEHNARRLVHQPVLNTDGDVQYIIHWIEDVTVHNNTLADLNKKHRQLQEAQAISSIGSFEWIVGNEEVEWSDEMYRIISMEPQAEGITVDHTNRLIHPDDFHKVNQLKKTSFTIPGHYGLTHRILLEDGTIKWVIHRFESISDEKGKVVRVHGTLQDVTEWKSAEQKLFRVKDAQAKKATEKYLSLFNSIDQGFCIIEVLFDESGAAHDYRFLEANLAFQKQTGLANAPGKTMKELVPDHEQYWFDIYGTVAKTGEPTRFENEAKGLGYYYEVYAFRIDAPEEAHVAILFNDITERKKWEEALRESEETFRSYVVASSDIVYKMSADWKTMYSLEGKNFLNSTGNASISWIENYIPAHEKDRVQKAINEAIGKKSMFELEHQVFDVRGNLAWTYSRALPRINQQGDIIDWIGAARDITEQVKAKEKIEASELQFKNVLLQSPNIFVILKGFPQMIITFANEPLFKSWGRTADIIGKPLLEAMPELKEQPFPTLLQRVFETGETYYGSEEKAVLIKNGVPVETYYVYVYQAIFDDHKKVTGLTIMATDITEQVTARRKIEESEKRFSNLLMESPFAFAILKGKDMVVALANDAIKRIWGKGNKIEGKPLLSLMPEVKEQGFAALLEKVFTTGQPFYGHEELVKLQRNGIWEDVYFNFIYQPYKEADETISGVTIIANEVTTQAIANKKIAASEQNVNRLFMQAPAAICVLRGPQHVVELANSRYLQLVGERDMIGKPIREALPELAGQGFYELLDNVYATGEPFVGNEVPAQLDQGAGRLEDVYLNFVYQASLDNEGKTDGILVHAVDVTEQILARKNIEENEKRQAYLLKLSDELRQLSDPLQIKEAACRVLCEHLHLTRAMYSERILMNNTEYYKAVGQHGSDIPFPIVPVTADRYRSAVAPMLLGQCTIVNDVLTDMPAEEYDSYLMYNIRSFVAAALLKNNKLEVVFEAHDNKPRRWGKNEILLIEETTERTWAAAERAIAETALAASEEKYRNQLEDEVLQRTAELKENKDLLQTVFDASPNSISVLEILYNEAGVVYDFKILIFNAFTIKTIGGRNVIGQKYSEAFPHVVESGVFDKFITAASSGEQTEFEKWYLGEGLHQCFRFIANKTGNLLLVTAEDITARKDAEEGLKTNLTLLQQSEDLAKIGSWEYEIATGKFSWSDGMYELFGLPKEMNVIPEVYLDHVIDEDYPVAQRIIKCFNEPQAFEETLCIKTNGSVREIKIKASIVTDEHGASFKLVGVDLDITEAKEAEKTLKEQAHFIRSTNEALPDILFVMNVDTKEFTYINHSYDERLGYSIEPNDFRWKNVFHLLYEDDVPSMLAHIEKMKTIPDGVVCEVEYRLKAADGSLHWFRDRNSVFKRDKLGTVIEKIGIAQDITESKKAEQKLKESNTSLRYANENLEQFASIASHDLQEPLRKLKMFASVLRRYDKELPEEARAVIQKISLTSVRMRQLITEVLQYSKVAYGIKGFVPTNLDHILQNVLSDLDLLLADNGATIQYSEFLPEIEAVPLQMNQLFYNLLTNALKFRKENENPIIQISYRIMPQEEVRKFPELHTSNPYIEIQFSDNGIGFQQEYAEQIFQLFERLFSADEYEGTGVGLALCKKIAENHNGHIYAESTYGKGAKFYILLPVSQKKIERE